MNKIQAETDYCLAAAGALFIYGVISKDQFDFFLYFCEGFYLN
ncbi:hypothetical protein ACFVHQ_02075 [Actinomycetes bacterium NPDC127524]